MQSYEFPYPEAEQQTVVSRFGGIDCRTHPTKVSLSLVFISLLFLVWQ